MIISRPQDRAAYQLLLGDGSRFGMSVCFAEQQDPRGIAEAFLIASDFVGDSRCALALGDNVFLGNELPAIFRKAAISVSGAIVFAIQVADPKRYGIVNFDERGFPSLIEEKPSNPTSNWAVTGLYFYDNSVLEVASCLHPSSRGELEISDVNQAFLKKGKLQVKKLHGDVAWYDAGTPESLFAAASHVRNLQRHQQHPTAVPELIALQNGWINRQQLTQLGQQHNCSEYGRFLETLGLDVHFD